MKKFKISYIFIILGTLIVMGYIGYSIWSFSNVDKDIICTDIEINLIDKDKTKLISQNEIAKIIENLDLGPIGKKYKNIHTEKIEDALLKNPMVKTAECYKTPSGILKLDVLQRSPKFIIAGQESYYIDNDRKLLPISLNYAAYLPVVSGRVTKMLATGIVYDFIDFLEKNPFWNAQIEQIYIREDMNVELIPRVGDAVIVLGKFDNYATKLENLKKLYDYGFSTIGWNRYQEIDLQYDNQIVCKKVSTEHTKPLLHTVQTNDSSVVKKI